LCAAAERSVTGDQEKKPWQRAVCNRRKPKYLPQAHHQRLFTYDARNVMNKKAQLSF